VEERDRRFDSSPGEALGWSRAAQDAAEAAPASAEWEEREPSVEPLRQEPRAFLDHPVGYGNYGSMLIVLGGVLGAIVAGLAGGDTSSTLALPSTPCSVRRRLRHGCTRPGDRAPEVLFARD
jgi:hypothetical protein